MAMNIRTKLTERIKDVLAMVSTPPQFTLKGSVQPTIDIQDVSTEVSLLTLPATAGNVNTTVTIPFNKRYVIRNGNVKLITDATVANRNITIEKKTPDNSQLYYFNGAAIAASTTSYLQITPTGFTEGAVHSGDAIGIPNGLIINPTQILKFSVYNGVAGDSYSGDIEIYESLTGRNS